MSSFTRFLYFVPNILRDCSLGDYSDTYVLVKGRVIINGAGADAATRQAMKEIKE